jgi:hypothetical protein
MVDSAWTHRKKIYPFKKRGRRTARTKKIEKENYIVTKQSKCSN